MSTETTHSTPIATASETGSPLAAFCAFFLERTDSKATGTLTLTREDGTSTLFLFENGDVVDLDPRQEHSVLVQAFLATGKVSEREVRKAQKRAGRGDTTAGRWLLERDLVPDDILLEHVVEVLTDHACAAFGDEVASFEFVEHGAGQRIEGFNSELSEVFDLLLDAEDLFVEAMRRQDDWDSVRALRPSLLDIYYATPQGMHYYNEPEAYEDIIAVLSRIDGLLDVEEVVDQVELNPFEVYQIVRTLARQGEVQPINPVQMFQLGLDTAAQKDHAKARRIFKRAIERGLDDFDVQFKLAECCAAVGETAEAAELFREFAEKCTQQFRQRSAIRAYHRVIDLDPFNHDILRRLLGLLVENERQDEGTALALEVAEKIEERSDARTALEHLLSARKLGLNDPKLKRAVIELAQKCGDKELLNKEISEDPSQLDQVLEPQKALESYRRLFAEGNDSVEIRLKLAELYAQQEDDEETLAQINGILGTPYEAKIEDGEKLAWLHKTRFSLSPGDMVSSRWLVDYHLKKGRTKEAISALRAHIERLEKDSNEFLLIEARKRLVALDQNNYDARWELVELYRKFGRTNRAMGEIESIARLAAKHEDTKTTREAWSALLELAPYHREGLRGVGLALAKAGDTQGALERLKLAARIALLSDDRDDAQTCLDAIRKIDSTDPEIVYALARARVEQADKSEKQPGVDGLVLAARLFVARRDLGSAREAVERAFCEAPGDAAVLDVKAELERAEASAGGTEVATPTPTRQDESAPPTTARPATAATPVTSGGELASEPFQGRRAVKKGTVAGITARLKGLKSDGGRPKATATGGKIVVGGLKKISSSLKNLQGGDATAAPSEEAGAPSPKRDPNSTTQIIADPQPQKLALKGAASRLKSLASGGGNEESDEVAEAANDKGGSDALEEAVKKSAAGVKVKKSLGGAAARLKSLATGAGSTDSEAGDEPPGETGENPALEEAVQKSAAGVKVKKSLGGAASKLAQLKKGGGADEPAAADGDDESGTGDEAALEAAARQAESGVTVKKSLGGAASRLARLKAASGNAPDPDDDEDADAES